MVFAGSSKEFRSSEVQEFRHYYTKTNGFRAQWMASGLSPELLQLQETKRK